MGNQTSTSSSSSSSSHIDIDRLRPFSRNGNSLGLSRSELDKRCQPSGLYADCDWEKNAIRRLVGDGRIAARQKGLESPDSSNGATEECPICFLYYSEVNTTKCCNACMCTECYLQVRPQKEKQSTCPFCNCDDFSVTMDKKKEAQEICPSETSTSISDSSGCSTDISTDEKPKKKASIAPDTPPRSPKSVAKKGGFGSELEKDERYQRMRKRSESFASSDGTTTPKKEQEIIQSVAMTPEERQRLEEEMKAQHFHPLVLRLENEAQERRLENDRAYQNSARGQQASASRNPHLSRRVRAARNWEQLASFLDQGDDMDGIGALESAMLYSRLAEASQGGEGNGSNADNNREQLEGFPLLRTLLTGQLDGNQGSRSTRSSRRQRHQFMRSGLGSLAMRNRGMGDVAMGTASLMMRGISEEDQINMAIAASMQDQQVENNNDDGEDTNETQEENESESDSSHDASSSSDNQAEDSESSVEEEQEEEAPLKQRASADEASTITELARVVTDSRSPDADTMLNGIAA